MILFEEGLGIAFVNGKKKKLRLLEASCHILHV